MKTSVAGMSLRVDVGPRPVRVFVAAHVRLYREALVGILADEDGLEVVGASGAVGRPRDSSEEPLTPRETEVAWLLDEGLSNKQIAGRLHLEVPTVKHHVHHILHKLGVASRAEAVVYLRRHGLLTAARRG